MAIVTGLTAERMLAIEGASIVGGSVDPATGNLILTTRSGLTIVAGNVTSAVFGVSDTNSLDLTLTGAGTPASPFSLKGDLKFATSAEVAAGTDATKAITSAAFKAALALGINGKLYITSTGDANSTATSGHPFQIGASDGPHIRMDNNEFYCMADAVTVASWAMNNPLNVGGIIRQTVAQGTTADSVARKDYADALLTSKKAASFSTITGEGTFTLTTGGIMRMVANAPGYSNTFIQSPSAVIFALPSSTTRVGIDVSSVSNGTGSLTDLELKAVGTSLFIGADTGTNPNRIMSEAFYTRTYTNAANCYITSNGVVGRSTSKLANKLAAELMPLDEDKFLDGIDLYWWFDKAESEAVADYYSALYMDEPTEDAHGNPLYDCPDELLREPGTIADYLHEAGLKDFVVYGANKSIEGVKYDRIPIALVRIVRGHRNRIRALEANVRTLNEDGVKLREDITTLQNGMANHEQKLADQAKLIEAQAKLIADQKVLIDNQANSISMMNTTITLMNERVKRLEGFHAVASTNPPSPTTTTQT